MSTKIGFEGTCTASNKLSPVYVDGIKHCYYDCALKFGDIDKPQTWNKQPLHLNPFFDVGTISNESFDYGSQVCIGQTSERNPEFTGVVVRETVNNPFSVSSSASKAPVARIIDKTLNEVK